MDLSVTSVLCMWTVWSADHFAPLFSVCLTPTDWFCCCKSDWRDSVRFSPPEDLNPASAAYSRVQYILTFRLCYTQNKHKVKLCTYGKWPVLVLLAEAKLSTPTQKLIIHTHSNLGFIILPRSEDWVQAWCSIWTTVLQTSELTRKLNKHTFIDTSCSFHPCLSRLI